jgi:hypothetical protein
LKSKDTQVVSPAWELSLGSGLPELNFKIILRPQATTDGRGGASFKKAKGKGRVLLKCENESESDLKEGQLTLSYRINISKPSGEGQASIEETPRGPVTHDFAKNAIQGLPEDNDVWDFSTVVDEASGKFVVCVEIIPAMPHDD